MLQVPYAEPETELRRSSSGSLFCQTGVAVQISESCLPCLGAGVVNPPFPFEPSRALDLFQIYSHYFRTYVYVLAVVSSVGEPIHYTPNRIEGFLLVKFSNLKPIQSCHDPTVFLKAQSLFPTRSSSACIRFRTLLAALDSGVLCRLRETCGTTGPDILGMTRSSPTLSVVYCLRPLRRVVSSDHGVASGCC